MNVTIKSRHRFHVWRALGLSLVVILVPFRGSPYEAGGHYFTVHVAVSTLHDPAFEGDKLVALCAQLPDQTFELDASRNYTDLMLNPPAYLQWAWFDRGSSEAVQRMYTTSKMLHALTGNSATELHPVAVDIIRRALATVSLLRQQSPAKLASARCALGFALHFYGDSWAHRMIDHPDQMYQTGRGHAFDLWYPDLPLYTDPNAKPGRTSARFELWRSYVRSLPEVIAGYRPGDWTAVDGSEAALLATSKADKYSESEFRDTLAKALPSSHTTALGSFDGDNDLHCQEYLERSLASEGIPQGASCEDAWRFYLGSAIPAFKNWDAGHPHHVDYWGGALRRN